MGPVPESAEAWFREGERQLELSRGADTQSEYRDDLTGAVTAFEEALARAPRHPGALRHRALTLARLERYEEALDGLVAATAALPSDVEL